MPDPAINIDDIEDIETVNRAVLDDLRQRIALSSSWEHFVYRETEIDQVWRLIEKHPDAVSLDADHFTKLRASIMAIHDLVGVEHKPQEAASLLASVTAG